MSKAQTQLLHSELYPTSTGAQTPPKQYEYSGGFLKYTKEATAQVLQTRVT